MIYPGVVIKYILKECVFYAFGWNVLHITVKCICCNALFKANVYSLIFHLNNLFTGVRGIKVSYSSFIAISLLCLLVFAFSIFKYPYIRCINIYRCILLLGWPLYHYVMASSLIVACVLKGVLCFYLSFSVFALCCLFLFYYFFFHCCSTKYLLKH